MPPPCIPFLYPDNGCWARAHEMCRLMIAMGLSPRKVWIMGSLQAATRNRQELPGQLGLACRADLVRALPALVAVVLVVQRMVIDPSLFTDGPVTVAYWKGLQGDPDATLTYTAAPIIYVGLDRPELYRRPILISRPTGWPCRTAPTARTARRLTPTAPRARSLQPIVSASIAPWRM